MSNRNDLPDIVFFNDRFVSKATRWWIQNGGIKKSDLACEHNVGLDEYCDDCVEQRLKLYEEKHPVDA